MKNKIWFLVMMAGVIIGIIACDDPKAQPVYCPDTDNNGNGHLGIGEDCSKDTGDCTGLYDYSKGTVFPKPIYRVGAEGNNGATFTSTAGAMATAYNGLSPMAQGRFNDKGLTEVHLHIGGKDYTWGGSGILKLQANEELAIDVVNVLSSSAGLPVAQLQPADNIRMAKGKKSTERFPVIAGGADKDPKVNTVAQNFRSNRQVIARNNRNVKTLLRQA